MTMQSVSGPVISSGDDFARLTYRGPIDMERAERLAGNAWTLGAVHPRRAILVDLRDTTLTDLSQIHVLMLTAHVDEMARFGPSVRIANVIPDSDERLRFARSLQAALELMGIDYAFFHEVDRAESWLRRR